MNNQDFSNNGNNGNQQFDPNNVNPQNVQIQQQPNVDPNINMQVNNMPTQFPAMQDSMAGGFPTAMMPMATNQFTYEMMPAQPAFNSNFAEFDPNVAQILAKKRKKKIIALSVAMPLTLGAIAAGIGTGIYFLKQKSAKDNWNDILNNIALSIQEFNNKKKSIHTGDTEKLWEWQEELIITFEKDINNLYEQAQSYTINQVFELNQTKQKIDSKVNEFKTTVDTFKGVIDKLKVNLGKNFEDSFKERTKSTIEKLVTALKEGNSSEAYNDIVQDFKDSVREDYNALLTIDSERKHSMDHIKEKNDKFIEKIQTVIKKINELSQEINELGKINYKLDSKHQEKYPSQVEDLSWIIDGLSSSNKVLHNKYYEENKNGQKQYVLIPNDKEGTLELKISYYYKLSNSSSSVRIFDNSTKLAKVELPRTNKRTINKLNGANDEIIPKLKGEALELIKDKNLNWNEDKFTNMIEQFSTYLISQSQSQSSADSFESFEYEGLKLKDVIKFIPPSPSHVSLGKEWKWTIKQISFNRAIKRIDVEYIISHKIVIGTLQNPNKEVEDRTEQMTCSISVVNIVNLSNEVSQIREYIDKGRSLVGQINNYVDSINVNYLSNKVEDYHKDIFDKTFNDRKEKMVSHINNFDNNKVADMKLWINSENETIFKEYVKNCYEKLDSEFTQAKEKYKTKKAEMDKLYDKLTNKSKPWKASIYVLDNSNNYLHDDYLLEGNDYDSKNTKAKTKLLNECKNIDQEYLKLLNENHNEEFYKQRNIEFDNEITLDNNLGIGKKIKEHENTSKLLYKEIKKAKAEIEKYEKMPWNKQGNPAYDTTEGAQKREILEKFKEFVEGIKKVCLETGDTKDKLNTAINQIRPEMIKIGKALA